MEYLHNNFTFQIKNQNHPTNQPTKQNKQKPPNKQST